MKSIISNKKIIDSNNYKNIVITQEASNDIKINVTGKLIDYPMEMTGVPFTKTIHSQEQSIITEEVIEYFKRNNVINYIKEGTVKGYYGVYISCGNLYNERTLSFKLDRSYKNSYNSILSKYQEDRLKFIEQYEDVSLVKIWSHRNTSEYVVTKDAEENYNSIYAHDKIGKKQKCLVLVLLENKPNELVAFEQQFIQDYLYQKIFLADESEDFLLSCSGPYVKYGRIKIKSRNFCIELPGCFYGIVQNLIIQRKMYLKELDENQMKLKLEMESK